MYTRNTNSKTNVTVVTISCNEKGCKARFEGTTNHDAWLKARKDGWLTPNAATAYCADHRVNYVVREGQAVDKATVKAERAAKKAQKPEKVTKGKVDQTKAEKVVKGKGKTSKPNQPTRKVTAPKATAFVGQSTGKLAKSAKKNTVR